MHEADDPTWNNGEFLLLRPNYGLRLVCSNLHSKQADPVLIGKCSLSFETPLSHISSMFSSVFRLIHSHESQLSMRIVHTSEATDMRLTSRFWMVARQLARLDGRQVSHQSTRPRSHRKIGRRRKKKTNLNKTNELAASRDSG